MNATFGLRTKHAAGLVVVAGLLAACGGGEPAPSDAAGAQVHAGPRERPLSSAGDPAPAPKLAIVATSRFQTPEQQAHVARFGLAIIAMGQTSTPASVAQTVAALKTRNPALQVAQMSSAAEVPDALNALSGPTGANNWWLRTAAGNRTAWQGSAGLFDANMTGFTLADADDRRYPQLRADFDSATFFAPAPAIDYVFSNLVWPQQVNADWRGIGSDQAWTDSTIQAAQRAGHVAYWDRLRSLHPNLKVIANASPAWWGSAEFAGRLHGAYLNSQIGRTWSIENLEGWAAMMARYRSALAATVAPKAVVFNMAAASTDFQSMRYGFASAMLEDGYFSLSATDGPEPAPWIDEFSASLGVATEPPPTATFSGTVWIRRYSGGMVLVNTSRTSAATVTLEPGFRRLAGSQAPAVNNGQEAGTVTLAARDGLVLVRSNVPPPKVAAVAFSRFQTATQQDHLARFNLAIVALPQNATPASVSATIAALKGRNPAMRLAQLSSMTEVADGLTALSGPTTSNNWWLRTAAGNRTAWQGSTGIFDANVTPLTNADADGNRFPQSRAGFDSATFFKPAPSIDFVYSNLVWPQQVNADWRRIGSDQSWTDPTIQAAQRVGHAAYWDSLLTQNPQLKVIANVSPAWIGSTEFAGRLHGAYLNSVIGRTWSIETRSGWAAMMAEYRAALAATSAPKAVVFNMAAASTDYTLMRYGLASALLEDGWFSLSATDGPEPAPWTDEFSAPLGAAAEPPPTAPYSDSVWMRRYSGGMVLVNTSRTASATVNVEAGYRRIAGSQAPAVNNGQAVGTVTLAPRDGLLLLRTGTVLQPVDTLPPTPPGALSISGLTCRSVTLAWQPASDNFGVVGYDIYRDGQFLFSVGGFARSAAITLNPGASWGLYVNARDGANNVSQASPVLQVQAPQCSVDATPPSTPTNLQGTVDGTSASLSWATSTDNVGVSAYDIFRNDVKIGSINALAYVDGGLAPNTAYRYAVAARDAQGNISSRSVSITLTTGSSCANVVCAVTQVGTDTDIPWGLITLPDGQLIYARRDAHDIVRLNPSTGVKTTIGAIPNVQSGAEGGLMGLATTPAFPATDPWLYAFHSSPTDNRIIRLRYADGTLDLASLQVLFIGIPKNLYHNGGRLRFGPDGKLYASTGDAQNGGAAQNLNSLAGKILRLNPDGSIPADNPFGSAVWSYGHRNPQGLAFDSLGRLWAQEFGNNLQDETNLIIKGGNYGWPNCEGTASVAGTGCGTQGYIAPKATYVTQVSSCSGLVIVRDVIYLGCLGGQRVYRQVISGSDLVNLQILFPGAYGRIRTVEPSLDGGMWMATSNGGDKDAVANNSNNRIFKVDLGL